MIKEIYLCDTLDKKERKKKTLKKQEIYKNNYSKRMPIFES